MTAALRTILVGFGGVAQGLATDAKMSSWFPVATHAQALQSDPRFDWVGVVDPDPDAQQAATGDWSVPSFGDVAAAANLEPDVAILAMPPGGRCDAVAALPSLKGVLVEKPLPHDEGERLADMAADRNLAVQVNYWRRGDETLRDLSDGGLRRRIGALQSGHAIYGNGLRNNGSHLLDMIRWLIGEPTGVVRTGPVASLDAPPIDGDVRVPFSLSFAGGGTVAVHPVDFDHYREVGLDLWGTTGRLTILQETLDIRFHAVADNRGLADAHEIASDTAEVLPSTVARALPNLYGNLYDAVAGDADLLSPLTNALKTEALIDTVVSGGATDTLGVKTP